MCPKVELEGCRMSPTAAMLNSHIHVLGHFCENLNFAVLYTGSCLPGLSHFCATPGWEGPWARVGGPPTGGKWTMAERLRIKNAKFNRQF